MTTTDHLRALAKPPHGICPQCDRSIPLRADGKIGPHVVVPAGLHIVNPGAACDGWGQEPKGGTR